MIYMFIIQYQYNRLEALGERVYWYNTGTNE